MDMAFGQAGTGDPQEFNIRLQVGDGGVARIAHGRANTAHQLMQHILDRTLVGNLPLDPLGNELQRL